MTPENDILKRLRARAAASPAAVQAARLESEYINFILALKKARETAELSQKQLAEILNVKQPQISKWEHVDTNNMTLRSIQQYLAAVDAELVLGICTKQGEYIPVTTKAKGFHSPAPLWGFSYVAEEATPVTAHAPKKWQNTTININRGSHYAS